MSEVRLIDANALKQDLRRYFTDGVLDGVSAKVTFNQILLDIDNAPTVHHPNCDICEDKAKQYSLGFQDGYLVGKEKPQGAWIRKEDVIHSIAEQYSAHGELVPTWLSIGDLKGGADMRGEKTDENS